jgi:CHAT domain-containing protein
MPDEDPVSLNNRAAALINRYQETADVRGLDQGIDLLRHALRLARRNPALHADQMEGNLASTLLHRFEARGDRRDLDEAMSLLRRLATEVGVSLNQSAEIVRIQRHRYKLNGSLDDIDRAIQLARFSLDHTPPNDPARGLMQHLLGLSLSDRFEMTAQTTDLDGAVEAHRAAASTGTQRTSHLVNLAGVMRRRYDLTGDAACLEEGIQAAMEALAGLPTAHQSHGEMRHLAGVLLRYRYETTGDPAHLAESVTSLRRSVEHPGTDEPTRAVRQDSLSNALLRQFQHSGDVDLLTEAIETLRATGAAAVTNDDRATRLNNLGIALRDRFTHFGDLGALREAVDLIREAVAVSAVGDAHTDYVSTLGVALQDLFQRTGEPQAAEEAVDAAREVLSRSADPAALETLANALRNRFDAHGAVEDLREAGKLLEEVLRLTPVGAPGHARCLGNLGNIWVQEFRRTSELAALDRAIAYLGRVTRADLVPAPVRAGYQTRFGEVLLIQYDRTRDPGVLRSAGLAFARAAASETAGALLRVRAASEWSATAARLDDWREAIRGAELAMGLIPEVTTRRLARADREHGLAWLGGVAADAAACALQAGDPELALRWLEQGRGVLMSQVLEAGGDFTELRNRYPALAQQLKETTDALDALDTDDTASDRRHAIAVRRYELLAEIRALPGFGAFLLPPSLAELHACATEGPVVLINISRHRCDALVLHRYTLLTVPLTELTLDAAVEQASRFTAALAASRVPGAEELKAQQTIGEVLEWLWDKVTGPILDRLPASASRFPRVWWSPGGPLSSLPVHAAERRDRLERPDAPAVLDRVISSYTPTVRALGHAQAVARRQLPATSLLVVAMPETEGEHPLPYARKESAALAALWPTNELAGAGATHDNVLAALTDHACVHFACHGVSDPDDPSSSRLLLHGARPLTVLEVSRLRLPMARLAVLSACHTAHAAPHLADEALHIAGAFQLAGYPNVVGTLWHVNDRIASRIAIAFHTKLVARTAGTAPDPRQAAAALHEVIREVRDHYPSSLWASYLHVGA